MNNEPILKARGLRKSYAQGSGELPILKGVDIDIRTGEAVCIVGASGAGKSTLLHILGTLDHPNEGEVFFEGESLFSREEEELARFRNEKMGFVFQFHHLLAEFTAAENVMMPCRIAGESKPSARAKALHLLEQMGLKERADHYPSQLSGGELQRVAIARALVRRPRVLFADEPTGNLDSHNSQMIQKLFFQLKEQYGLTLVVVTHDGSFAQKFGRVLRISDGQWAANSF
jgi:lipoprotein-releasing system ATP-binding protein